MATHSEAGLISLTTQRAIEAWYLPQQPPHTSPHKLALHDFAADRIGRGTDLRYLEFGVYEGYTIQRFAAIFTNPAARFIGFDSFTGLPETWGGLPAGHFSTEGRVPVMNDARISFVPGWFQNSLPEFAAEFEPGDATLVHFDADLYSSTLFLLTSLWWILPEYWFIFDEFMGEELAAMRNFVTAYPVDVEFHSHVLSRQHGVPEQVFGRLRVSRMVVNGVE